MDLIIRLNPIITCKFSKQLISTCSLMVYGSQYSDVNASKQRELPLREMSLSPQGAHR